MTSRVTVDFLERFARLPEAIKEQARKSYLLWRDSPSHPGLHFKRIHGHEALYSVRVSRGWRALGLLEGEVMTWFWIGSHAEYEEFIK